jgi:undecaprenyl-diphosphatase
MIRYRWGLVGFVALVTAFRLWYLQQGFLELSPDEAHYWEWSRRLDWSYYSKGPMVAYLIALSTGLGGSTELFVRLPAVLLAAATTLLLFRLARALLDDEGLALAAAILPNLTPVFGAYALLMTIDAPLLFFWTLTLWLVHRAVAEERAGPWYAAGAALGAGLLSKYSMAFLAPCVFLYLATSPARRRWLGRKEPYLMLLVAIVVFTPVIAWNLQHAGVSLRHVMGQAEVGKGLGVPLSLRTFGEFVGSQALVLTPLLFVALLVALVRAGRRGFSAGDDRALFLFWASAPVLLIFVVLSLRQKAQANWAAPAYVAGLVAVVAYFGHWRRKRVAGGPPRAAWGAIALSGLVALGLTAAAHDPGLFARLGFPPDADPTVRLKGWRALGSAVGSRAAAMPSSPFLLSDRYQISSELAFYAPGQPRTYSVNLGRRLNQYDLWDGLAALAGRDAIYVQPESPTLSPPLRSTFRECADGEPVVIHDRGREIKRFYLFRCTGFSGVAPRPPVVRY